ncbi:hypothetical protein AVEN_162681-1 [Araneus ventricosus]|uniref:Uncharacterized protein n=1 Tax=Araneus ventricosus TaxID=182803 RepID=A0A4Y2IDE9_ARAVE|nr:hypothetical protein AVEN_162681-1 [Araneus ventricosus]
MAMVFFKSGVCPAGVVRKIGERVPVQTVVHSSDRSSKLRRPSQNNRRVASKWDFNITKLNSSSMVIAKSHFDAALGLFQDGSSKLQP